MHYTIIDCYTDEASGLGVPPYLGTYPRYIYGQLKQQGHKVSYCTIDDLRLLVKYDNIKKEPTVKQKTNILIYNTTKNDLNQLLQTTNSIIFIVGVHVPGKYLTAKPGTLKEIKSLTWGLQKSFGKNISKKMVLTGPALFGTQLEGGKFAETEDVSMFEVKDFSFSFSELDDFAHLSAEIMGQIPLRRVIEIETARGCDVGKCSFCTEPLKSSFCKRKMENVLTEIKSFYETGARYFRLGKQADFYAIDRPVELLKNIRKECPDIEMLHIDNVNPNSVIRKGIGPNAIDGEKITKAIVKYCTPGNIAAFGVESFDLEVVKANKLNTAPNTAMKAIEIINKYGEERGENGLHKFLPGINLIFGLLNENKKTHEANIAALKKVIGDGLLLRRINLRQVAVMPNTYLELHGGNKFLRKNKKYYWKWRNQIRQEIDYPMLKLLFPTGTILKDVWTEMYDGKTTFCRQMATYPIVIGVKGRLPLNEKINVKVIDHMLRGLVAEVIK
jgi:radical SAM superfamily enzyme with C-terminal helix-hairpin-helix motif